MSSFESGSPSTRLRVAPRILDDNSRGIITSFDIFDTILTRRFITPPWIFHETALELQKLGVDFPSSNRFVQWRMQAERRVRGRRRSKEVTFEEIWRELVAIGGFDTARLTEFMNLEIEAESRNL
ncbi:MAG: hypothetical protein AAGA58_18100, partial [Verrucomicrobiota bacterium]